VKVQGGQTSSASGQGGGITILTADMTLVGQRCGQIVIQPGANTAATKDGGGVVPIWTHTYQGAVAINGPIRLNAPVYINNPANAEFPQHYPSIRLPVANATGLTESSKGNVGDIRIGTNGLFCKIRGPENVPGWTNGSAGTWAYLPWQAIPAPLAEA
jgi:hypothetical protein